MSCLLPTNCSTRPRNLCELLLRDVAALLITSHLVSRAVKSLRPECRFSRELLDTLDAIIATSDAGEMFLQAPLSESGAILPDITDTSEGAQLRDFFTQLPVRVAPGVLAAEVVVNLRLLVQHVELKIRLAAEEALLVGQNALCHALMIWAAEWCACSRALRVATVRARARAYIADLEPGLVVQSV